MSTSRACRILLVPKALADIAAELGTLTAADFDPWREHADGWERLAAIRDELEQNYRHDVAAISRLLLAFVERLDGADIGSPRPVVHLLERLPGYEQYLRESLTRRPAQLTVWMANRILNDPAADRSVWLDLLSSAANDESLRRETQEDARSFLSYQQTRSE